MTVSYTHLNQLTHGEDEVGFQRQRVFLFGVLRVDVQRIDIIRAHRRDADDLTVELLYKGEILGFGVADDDVILRDEAFKSASIFFGF